MKYFEIPSGKCTTDRQRKSYRNNTTSTTASSLIKTAHFEDIKYLTRGQGWGQIFEKGFKSKSSEIFQIQILKRVRNAPKGGLHRQQ